MFFRLCSNSRSAAVWSSCLPPRKNQAVPAVDEGSYFRSRLHCSRHHRRHLCHIVETQAVKSNESHASWKVSVHSGLRPDPLLNWPLNIKANWCVWMMCNIVNIVQLHSLFIVVFGFFFKHWTAHLLQISCAEQQSGVSPSKQMGNWFNSAKTFQLWIKCFFCWWN